MFDAETIKAVLEAGISVIAFLGVVFLYYKSDSRWSKTIEKMDKRQGESQAKTDRVIEKLTEVIRDRNDNNNK